MKTWFSFEALNCTANISACRTYLLWLPMLAVEIEGQLQLQGLALIAAVCGRKAEPLLFSLQVHPPSARTA